MKRSNRFLSLCLVFTMVLCAYSMVTKEVTAASDYTTWKQYDSRWGSKTVGKNGTMASWGCKITTLAILMVHSGVENENNFNPGILRDRYTNAGYISYSDIIANDGNLSDSAVSKTNSPNFYKVGTVDYTYSSFSSIRSSINSLLNSGYFVEVRVNNNQHSVAVKNCTATDVNIMDPGYSKSVLSQWDGTIIKATYYKATSSTPANPEKISVTYQTYDDVTKQFLPNVVDAQNYAGIFGHDVDCLYASLSSGNITYKVHYKGGSWLSEVTNRSDYAGIKGKPIDGLSMKTDTGRTIHYRVHLRTTGEWLPYVTGYNTSDSDNGYAGTLGQEIDAVQIYLD